MKFLKRLIYGGLGWCAKTQDYCPQGCYGVDCGNCKKVLKAKPKDIANYYGMREVDVLKYYRGKKLDFERLCADLERRVEQDRLNSKELAVLDTLYSCKGGLEKINQEKDLFTLVDKGLVGKTGANFWITDKGIEKYEYVKKLFGGEKDEKC